MAYVDTDLTRGFDVPKTSPEQIVQRALDGLEAGAEEVLADELTQRLKQAMTAESEGLRVNEAAEAVTEGVQKYAESRNQRLATSSALQVSATDGRHHNTKWLWLLMIA